MLENETHTTEPFVIPVSETGLIPLSEIEIDPEKHNVLHGLLEIRDEGRDVGKYLVQQFLAGQRIVITGEPAVGKSALLVQIVAAAYENARRRGIPFERKVGQYDFVLEAERRLRRRTGQEGRLEGEEFNQRLYEAIMESDIFEVPAVGSKEEVDRGRSAVEKIENRIAAGDDERSILVSLYSSPLIQTQGEAVRAEIAKAPVNKVFRILDAYGMNIEGIERNRQNAGSIKEIFKLMATDEHIAAIRREVTKEIADWHLKIQIDMLQDNSSVEPSDVIGERSSGLRLVPLTADDFRKLFQKFGIESSSQSEKLFEKRAQDAVEQMTDQAIYMEWRYREQLNIGSGRAIIAGNAYADNKTVYDLRPLLGQRAAADT